MKIDVDDKLIEQLNSLNLIKDKVLLKDSGVVEDAMKEYFSKWSALIEDDIER